MSGKGYKSFKQLRYLKNEEITSRDTVDVAIKSLSDVKERGRTGKVNTVKMLGSNRQ